MRLPALFAMVLGLAAYGFAVSIHAAPEEDPMNPPVDERCQPKPYITLKHPE